MVGGLCDDFIELIHTKVLDKFSFEPTIRWAVGRLRILVKLADEPCVNILIRTTDLSENL